MEYYRQRWCSYFIRKYSRTNQSVWFLQFISNCIRRKRQQHVGHGVGMSRQLTLRQVFGDHLAQRGRVKADLTSAQTVVGIGEQGIQRHHAVIAGQIGGNVVRIRDAHIGRGVGGNVGDHILIDAAVISVELQRHLDIGIDLLELLDRILVDIRLGDIALGLGPEGDLIGTAFIEARRQKERVLVLRAMAARQKQTRHQQENQ